MGCPCHRKGWRGRRELAPRCSATQLSAPRHAPGLTRRVLSYLYHTHHTHTHQHTQDTTHKTPHTHTPTHKTPRTRHHAQDTTHNNNTTTRHRQHTHTQAYRDLKIVLNKSMNVRANAGELCLIRAYFRETRGDTDVNVVRYTREKCGSLFPSGQLKMNSFIVPTAIFLRI